MKFYFIKWEIALRLQVFFYILTVVGIQVMVYVIYDNFDSL